MSQNPMQERLSFRMSREEVGWIAEGLAATYEPLDEEGMPSVQWEFLARLLAFARSPEAGNGPR